MLQLLLLLLLLLRWIDRVLRHLSNHSATVSCTAEFCGRGAENATVETGIDVKKRSKM